MAHGHPATTITLALDLDDTVFDSSITDRAIFNGDKDMWLSIVDLMASLQEKYSEEVFLDFRIISVSSKPRMDDMHDAFIPIFINVINDAECLHDGGFTYQARCDLTNKRSTENTKTQVPTKQTSFEQYPSIIVRGIISTAQKHYEDAGLWKADVLSRYAAEHDVKHENIIMVDDLPEVCSAVQRAGMKAVNASTIKTHYEDADAQKNATRLVVNKIHKIIRQTTADVVSSHRLELAAKELEPDFPPLGSTPTFDALSRRDQKAALDARASTIASSA